jgi:flagellar M-ring protein FliF
MDFLNQASAQITNLFRSMSAGARIVAGLLVAVIVISLAYLFNHQFAGPDSYLMGGEPVSPQEINEVIAAFGQANLRDFQLDGHRIRVPRGQEATYMAALADAGALPKNYGSYLQKALADAGPLVSKSKEAQMTKLAVQQELQHVIRKFKGVNDAQVIYAVREEPGLHKKNTYTASVSISTTGGQPLDEGKVMSIRALVASSIGMPPESVAVTDLDRGFTYPPTQPGQVGSGWQDPYIQSKMRHEQIIADTIRGGLMTYIPGVVVSCNVELKNELEHLQNKTQHDPKTVNVIVQEENKTLTSEGPQPQGPPGLGSQGGVQPNQPAVARAPGTGAKTDEESSRSTVRSLTNIDEQRIKLAPLTPSRVTAAIGVPSSYIEQVWLKNNPPQPGQAPAKPTAAQLKLVEEERVKAIQEHAAQLIPLPDQRAANPIPMVRVTVFPDLPGEPPPEAGISDHALAWLGTHWSTLGTGLLGLVSLVMLRSMVRSVPAPEPIAASTPMAPDDDEIAEPVAGERLAAAKVTPAQRLKRREKGGPSLREELVEVVREDPEAAANVLRSWINSAT